MARGRLVPAVLVVLAPFADASAQLTRPLLGIDHFTVADGLPGMYVPDLAVTTDGLLWIQASGRLVSFDGLDFETHDLERFRNKDEILRGIGAGRADTLWTIVGDALYSDVRGETALRRQLGQLGRNVWQEGDDLWILDDDGILRLTDSGEERVARFVQGWRMGSTSGSRAGASDKVRLHFNGPGSVQDISAPIVLDPLPFPEAWPVPDPHGSTLISLIGDESTDLTRPDGSLVVNVPRALGTMPVFRDSRGLIWMRRPGAVTALGPDGQIVQTLALAPGAVVVSAVEDAEGSLWMGTVTDGLYRIRRLSVRTLAAPEGVTDGQVLRVAAGPDSSVLAIHHAGILTRISDRGAETILGPIGIENVAGALTDSRGTLWISYTSEDVDRLEGRTREGSTIVLRLPWAWRVLEDPSEPGVLWVMSGGLRRVRPYAPGGPVVEGPFLEPRWNVRDMIVAPAGDVWVTGMDGLAHVTGDRVETISRDEEVLSAGRAVHRSEDGAIWIGHYDLGLVRFKNGEFRRVTREDGLWDVGASTILEDDAGNLWMSSNLGVHRAARAELDAFLDGRIDRIRGRGYGAGSGFRNTETSGFNGYRDPAGRLWFPTFSGVAVIDPEAVLGMEHTPPRIRIRAVTADTDELELDTLMSVPRGKRRLELAFGAVLLSGQSGLHYEVLLEGVDAGWVDVGGQRQVTYGSVPPGRHRFRARAISGSGVAGVQEAGVTLVVPPYFRETAVFNLLLSMVAGGVLLLLYLVRVRQLRQREVTLRGMVDARTSELARAKEQTEAALETVEAQAAQLRSLDEAKSRFFANVSHELRTPLTLVQGPLQDILDGRLGPTPELVRSQVETVLHSGRRLGQLIEQLLDVAKLEAGKLSLNVRREDLAPQLARLAQAFEALGRSRGIAFEWDIPEGAILATVDADQIEKVWANLLANAMKFTPSGGRVSCSVHVDAGRSLVVSVQDDGPGIPDSEVQRIFERFHQVDASSRRAYEGTGLGLALVKEVTELHRGTVEVRPAPGGGSVFVVRVPADAAIEAQGYGAPSLPPREVVHGSRHMADPHPGDDARRPAVLIVEDNAELRAYLRRHLEEEYRIVEAVNGWRGLEAARRDLPDVILCDIMMPEMDGEELCKAVRSDPELAFLPVVMVTARASRESRLSAFQGGADDYLVKPFDPEELRLRMRNLLLSRQRLAERLREEGKALPFVELERPGNASDAGFAAELEAVMRQRMTDESLGVEDIARAMAMSRATLYRKAQEALGLAPMELLWGYRLQQAAHWLRETDATVSEVAYGTGFKTVQHFTRRFKEQFDVTPATWRAGG